MAKKKPGQNQNNGLRMVLFYLTCGIVLVLASYSGLYFTFGHLSSGMESGDKSELEAGINFHKLQGAIRTQMPENLAQIKVDAGPYANSAIVENKAPKIEVNADTFIDLVNKSGICAPAGSSGGYDPDACDLTLDEMHYSTMHYTLRNKADKNIWAKLIVGKDESVIVWRLLSATLSKPVLERIRQ